MESPCLFPLLFHVEQGRPRKTIDPEPHLLAQPIDRTQGRIISERANRYHSLTQIGQGDDDFIKWIAHQMEVDGKTDDTKLHSRPDDSGLIQWLIGRSGILQRDADVVFDLNVLIRIHDEIFNAGEAAAEQFDYYAWNTAGFYGAPFEMMRCIRQLLPESFRRDGTEDGDNAYFVDFYVDHMNWILDFISDFSEREEFDMDRVPTLVVSVQNQVVYLINGRLERRGFDFPSKSCRFPICVLHGATVPVWAVGNLTYDPGVKTRELVVEQFVRSDSWSDGVKRAFTDMARKLVIPRVLFREYGNKVVMNNAHSGILCLMRCMKSRFHDANAFILEFSSRRTLPSLVRVLLASWIARHYVGPKYINTRNNADTLFAVPGAIE